MKKLVFAFAAVAAVCLASCGGNANTETATEEAAAPVEEVVAPAENDSTAAVEEAATDTAAAVEEAAPVAE